MKVDVEELGACKRRLQVEETPEVVQEAWARAFTRVQREAKLPGFRKGKVPRSMVKLHFSNDVRQEVARHLIPEVYRQALAETQLKPVEEPDLQEVTLEESAPLKFSAVVEIKPTIALGQYAGLAVQHAARSFTEAEVDEALAHLQEQQAEYRAVERPADVGDLVIVDYSLTPEGMEPRTETGYGLVIGSGAVLKEIDEAVIGLGPGGARQTRVRFPDDHRNEALRGKAADAEVKVSEVKEKVLPPIDDDFAKTMGQFETLDALRAEMRKGLERRRQQENRRALEDAVIEAALAAHTFEVPESMVLRQVGHQIEHVREQMRRQGMDPSLVPWDYQKMLEDMRPSAEKAVKRALLIEAIAQKENIQASDEDLEKKIDELAKEANQAVAVVRKYFKGPQERQGLSLRLREEKTIEFLKGQAKYS